MNNVGMVQTPEIQSQLGPGEHVVLFHGGPRLFLELDSFACEQLGPQAVLDRVDAALGINAALDTVDDSKQKFEESYPLLVKIAMFVGPIVAKSATKKMGAKVISSPVGIIALYIAAYIAIRWAQLIVVSHHSQDGGVLIEFGPPYYPLQLTPEIWPRGGPKYERAEKALELGKAAVTGKVTALGDKAIAAGQDAINRPVAKRRLLHRPPRRFGRR